MPVSAKRCPLAPMAMTASRSDMSSEHDRDWPHMDLAVEGDGWDCRNRRQTGTEAYTRAGSLNIGRFRGFAADLQRDCRCWGNAGPSPLPPADKVEVAPGTAPSPFRALGRGAKFPGRRGSHIKLVNPILQNLRKGEDGLMARSRGLEQPADVLVSSATSRRKKLR